MNSRWTFRQTAPQNTTMRPHVAEKRQSGTRVFPLSAHNEKAAFEIPYGSIERPTTRKTPAEQAEFEVPELRWADISDATHGFSLLNDCKYGYDAKGNVLRLSLLRSPEWPDPHADEGWLLPAFHVKFILRHLPEAKPSLL